MIILPNVLDLTPKGKIVPRADIGECGYFENVEYRLSIEFIDGEVNACYIGDDGSLLHLAAKNYKQQMAKLVKIDL